MLLGLFPGVSCGTPTEVTNASIKTASGYFYNNEVKYECNKGHQLRGNDTIACMMNGNWTEIPTCDGKVLHTSKHKILLNCDNQTKNMKPARDLHVSDKIYSLIALG